MRRYIIGFLVVIILAFGVVAWHLHTSGSAGKTAAASKQTTSNTQRSVAVADFNKHQYSTSDPTSIWVVVNKKRPLQPADYAPTDLVVPNVPLRVPGNVSMQVRKVAATALEKMFAGAHQQGYDLMLSSGYRPYTYQVSLYGSYAQKSGTTAADTYSARPGYSEHQTGLAADVEPVSKKCDVDQCFGQLPEGKWLAANAYKYGFVIRYPQNDTSVTGYEYEPWHVRYIGIPAATEMHTERVPTLEKFFGLQSAPDYSS